MLYCRVQANYVMWRAAASSVPYLNDDLRKRQLEYTTIVTGRTERESRWKECIDISAGRYLKNKNTHRNIYFTVDYVVYQLLLVLCM